MLLCDFVAKIELITKLNFIDMANKYLISFIFLVLNITSIYTNGFSQNQLHKIPTQSINPYKLLGDTTNITFTINEFEISNFVKYKEYKQYLNEIKRDSSIEYYLSQLPDTNIGNKEVYNKYLNSSKYDDSPVIGISWDNAMNFCKWKTIKENPKDSFVFIYRLPDISEWLSAYSFTDEKNIKNDFNKNYSDWLLNSMDDSHYEYSNNKDKIFPCDYIYFHKREDPLVLKRKLVIGDSFLFQKDKLMKTTSASYYATEGYRQIGFRNVKVFISKSKKYFIKGITVDNYILKYWGLKTK